MAQTIELVRVKTTLGDRVYPLDTRVYSNVGGNDSHLRKYVGDLSEGEMILWHNEGIEKTLPEIEPHLQKSPRYAQAEQAVYATNSEGQKIPQLRIQLIKALAAKGIVTAETPQDLEQKIMREQGNDFTSHEYSAMADFLYQGIQQAAKEDKAPKYESDAQIKAWLHGKTAGPLNHKTLYSLALATDSPVLDEWFMKATDTATSSTGFWGAYKFYTILRRSVMGYLARAKGYMREKLAEDNKGEAKEEAKKGPGIDTTPETQIVLSQFMEEINEEFSLTRVLGVETVAVARQELHQQKEKQGLKLAKGAYTGEAREGLTTIPLDEILAETNFLASTIHYAFGSYISGFRAGKYPAPETFEGTPAIAKYIGNEAEANTLEQKAFIAAIVIETRKKLGLAKHKTARPATAGALKEENPDELINLNGIIVKLLDEHGKPFYPTIRESIASPLSDWAITGRLDEALGLKPQTIYRAMQHWTRLYNSVPTIYDELMFTKKEAYNPAIDKQQRRNFENRYDKLKEKVIRKYGLSQGRWPGSLLTEICTEMLIQSIMEQSLRPRPNNLRPEIAEKLARDSLDSFLDRHKLDFSGINDPSYLKEAKAVQMMREAGATLLTKAECIAILERHGLSELMRFIPEANFALDDTAAGIIAETETAKAALVSGEAA